jgi:two-component system cell cycle response regulator
LQVPHRHHADGLSLALTRFARGADEAAKPREMKNGEPMNSVHVEQEGSTDRLTPVWVAPRLATNDEAPQRDTPLLPAPPPAVTESRATLTVMTGMQAGRIIALDGTPIIIGKAADSGLAVDDIGVSRHHVRVARSEDGGFYAEDLGSTNGTFRGKDRIGVIALNGGDLLQIGPHLQVRFAIVDSLEVSLYRRLYESSVRDPLTHLFNRQYLDDTLCAETARARRSGGELAILMIDVDCLKSVNDLFGHLAGDRALCTIAARILRVLRVEDMMARYGGDEFVVVAAGTDPAGARHLAQRARRAVEGLHMSARGHEVHITASIGIASLKELDANDDPVVALLALADARMYAAKALGRNQVCEVSPASAHPAK